MSQKRLLMLSTELSGINKFLFTALKNLGWELVIEDIPMPKSCRWAAIVASFHPHMKTWKRRFEISYMKVCKMEWAFRLRSQYAGKIIEKYQGQYDFIFQISSMFAPSLNFADKKYLLWIDYTTILSKDYHGWAPFPFELNRRLALEKKIYGSAKLIFSTSENTRRSLIEYYRVPPQKVVNTGNGLNLQEMKVFDKKYDGETVLFIGMDFERKGGLVLLEAFKKVRQAIPQARLLIIGPNKNILDIDQEGVEFLGNISDRKTIESYYEKASIFVMPSLCEPFGLVFLEAMAYKIPCIGTNRDAMPEIITNGQNGYLAVPGDVADLCEKIILLLKDKSAMRQMGENAYQFVQKNFLWEKVVSRIETALKSLN